MAASILDSKRKRAKLKPKPSPYFEKVVTGVFIGFRKTANGSESWVGRVRKDGKQIPKTFKDVQSYEDALSAVRAWSDALMRGECYQTKTLQDAVDEYVRDFAAKKNEQDACSTQTRLYAALPDSLLAKKLSDLSPAHIRCWLNDLVTKPNKKGIVRTKSTANRIYNNFKAALNLGYQNEWIGDKPWEKVKAFKNADESRELFLTDEQVQALLNAADGGLKDLIHAGVLTGGRYGEIAGAKVKDLSIEEGTLILSSNKTGKRTVWLSDAGLDFFRERSALKLPSAYLILQDNGKAWGKSNHSREFFRACRRAKLPDETIFYSLRHYHISKALLAGVSAQVVAENCGTSIRMIEKHYGKFLKSDRRKMMNNIEIAHLSANS